MTQDSPDSQHSRFFDNDDFKKVKELMSRNEVNMKYLQYAISEIEGLFTKKGRSPEYVIVCYYMLLLNKSNSLIGESASFNFSKNYRFIVNKHKKYCFHFTNGFKGYISSDVLEYYFHDLPFKIDCTYSNDKHPNGNISKILNMPVTNKVWMLFYQSLKLASNNILSFNKNIYDLSCEEIMTYFKLIELFYIIDADSQDNDDVDDYGCEDAKSQEDENQKNEEGKDEDVNPEENKKEDVNPQENDAEDANSQEDEDKDEDVNSQKDEDEDEDANPQENKKENTNPQDNKEQFHFDKQKYNNLDYLTNLILTLPDDKIIWYLKCATTFGIDATKSDCSSVENNYKPNYLRDEYIYESYIPFDTTIIDKESYDEVKNLAKEINVMGNALLKEVCVYYDNEYLIKIMKIYRGGQFPINSIDWFTIGPSPSQICSTNNLNTILELFQKMAKSTSYSSELYTKFNQSFTKYIKMISNSNTFFKTKPYEEIRLERELENSKRALELSKMSLDEIKKACYGSLQEG